MSEPPKHIAFIMDGNGRWAKRRLMPRSAGHREGVKALERVVTALDTRGVRFVTFFVFSTENWKRPEKEVNALFKMIVEFSEEHLQKYKDKNVQMRTIGDTAKLPAEVQAALKKTREATQDNTGMTVTLAINYGGRDEIIRACQKLAVEGKEFTSSNISNSLDTAGIPDPDIIVRSSGEQRLSNFMLWQAAYSELMFVEEHWPEFNDKLIHKIITAYLKRERRFGAV